MRPTQVSATSKCSAIEWCALPQRSASTVAQRPGPGSSKDVWPRLSSRSSDFDVALARSDGGVRSTCRTSRCCPRATDPCSSLSSPQIVLLLHRLHLLQATPTPACLHLLSSCILPPPSGRVQSSCPDTVALGCAALTCCSCHHTRRREGREKAHIVPPVNTTPSHCNTFNVAIGIATFSHAGKEGTHNAKRPTHRRLEGACK